jgi:nucleoside-diphosphate-sugar epimerase
MLMESETAPSLSGTSSWAGARILITGGTGFIGNALAHALADQGAEVHVIARRVTRTACTHSSVVYHTTDVTDPGSLAPATDGFTHIIHAAGLLGRPGIPAQTYWAINVSGTRNVMSAALRAGGNVRVLHVSTTGVLGPAKQELYENSPCRPKNVYESSKAAAENIVREFVARGLPVVIARPALVYGPGDQHVLKLFQAIKNCRFVHINAGRHFCQPTFIADTVAGLLLCLQKGQAGETFHIAGPTVTFREFVASTAAEVGVRVPRLSIPRSLALCAAQIFEVAARATGRIPTITRAAVRFFSEDRVVSCSKAQRELGYAPRYDLATGIAETIRWYCQHQWL